MHKYAWYFAPDPGRPWLLETNATPSLAVEHDDSAVQELIHAQKMGMVKVGVCCFIQQHAWIVGLSPGMTAACSGMYCYDRPRSSAQFMVSMYAAAC